MSDKPIDPFKVKKSRKKKETLHERKLRLEAELAEIEQQEKDAASSVADVVDRIAELATIIGAAKEAYGELDNLVENLIETGDTEFTTTSGEKLHLIDNFDGKNKAWKSVAFQRYSAKLV